MTRTVQARFGPLDAGALRASLAVLARLVDDMLDRSASRAAALAELFEDLGARALAASCDGALPQDPHDPPLSVLEALRRSGRYGHTLASLAPIWELDTAALASAARLLLAQPPVA